MSDIDIANSQLFRLSHALRKLESEMPNAGSSQLDTLSAEEIAALMNREETRAVGAVGKVLPQVARAIEAAAAALGAGGRVIYVGAGTSGRLGVLDASEIPPTFSAPPGLFIGLVAGGPGAMFGAVEGAEDDPERGAADLEETGIAARDFVVGLAASGRTPYVLGAVRHARICGAVTAGISSNPSSELSAAVEIAITPELGPEILSGSTRLKSGSAQKQILNMISTGAMVRLGKCYGNRMVDLAASNEKLRARALNLVADLAEVSAGDALAALCRCGWEIKTAILMLRAGLSLGAARAIVAEAGGHLRPALAAAGQARP